jgi:hypothetical protein
MMGEGDDGGRGRGDVKRGSKTNNNNKKRKEKEGKRRKTNKKGKSRKNLVKPMMCGQRRIKRSVGRRNPTYLRGMIICKLVIALID